MRTSIKWLLLGILCLLLTSCGKNSVEESPLPTISYELSENPIIALPVTKVVFSKSDRIPIVEKDNIVGYLKINFTQKLGIWDWYNAKAVSKGIKHSFTVNMSINMKESINSFKTLSIKPEIYLEDSNSNIVGEPCLVGWSGFNSVGHLFTDTPSTTIETGVQPLVGKLPKGSRIKIKLESDGHKLDDIYLDASILAKSSKGSSIKTINDTAVLKSINGAKYSIKLNKVFIENHNYGDNNNNNRDSVSKFIDFDYSVNYLSKPTNNKEVANFDTFKGDSLSSKFIAGVITNTDNKIMYDSITSAERLFYADSSESEFYVTSKFLPILKGQTAIVTSNRLLNNKVATPKYVRIMIEFPEESSARTLNQLKSFNGRYLVFQIELKERVLHNEK